MFYTTVKRVAIDICEFMALAMGILFFWVKMIPFINSAILLNYINGQTISYLVFALLLIALPIILLYVFKKANKGVILRRLFYVYAAVILCGTVFDLISYKFFIGYEFMEGDAIFVNMMWNMPNIGGVIMSIIVATLYILLGKQIKRTRRLSYILYIITFLTSHIPTFIYTFIATGGLPRDTYLQKSLYVIAIQLLILGALTLAATSRSLWKSHVWN